MPSERKLLELGRQRDAIVGLVRQPAVPSFVPARLVPQLKLVALPEQDRLPVQGREFTQLPRE